MKRTKLFATRCCLLLLLHLAEGFFSTSRPGRNVALRYRNHDGAVDDESYVDRSPKVSSTRWYFAQRTDELQLKEEDARSQQEARTTRNANSSTHLQQTTNEQAYQNLLLNSLARSLLAILTAVCISYPIHGDGLFLSITGGVVAAVPMIYLLPVSHQDWRLRQDALSRLYGRDDMKHVVAPRIGLLALNSAIQDEVVFRWVMCTVIASLTGSTFMAMILSSLLYSRLTSLERFVEGLWYSNLLFSGVLGLPGLIVAHCAVAWHWDVVCWKHVIKQLEYVEATPSTGDLHRFFLAHDSRHCGKLNAHDMRRALEYISEGRISREEVEILQVHDEFDYGEFEARLRELHAKGALHR